MENNSKKPVVKIKLTEINESIFEKIPKSYAETLFNMAVTKSLTNGSFMEYASLLLSPQTISELKEMLNQKEVNKPKENKAKEYIKTSNNGDDNGFDF